MAEAQAKKKATSEKNNTVSANLKGIEEQFNTLRQTVIDKAPWANDPSNSDVVRFAIITAAQAVKKGG
jgi:hypothetical protein